MGQSFELSSAQFVQMIVSGHRHLQAHVEQVNALNVFPVPDGDTGTNMELSLRAGVEKLGASSEWTLSDAAYTFAAGLLMGARGNSGVILSQLFRGFQKHAQRAQVLDAAMFADALADGVQIAYQAVTKPVEGTILTVAREASVVGIREAKLQPDITSWLDTVLHAARIALAKTPEQLPVLKQAGVVDSGGQGFVYILEGFLQYLSNFSAQSDEYAKHTSSAFAPAAHNKSRSAVDESSIVAYAAAQMEHSDSFGYCTEVLVQAGSNAERVEQILRQRLAEYGDSLLVVGVTPFVKVHVHTEYPGRVLEDAIVHGPLVKIKIENMSEQHAEILNASDDAQDEQLVHHVLENAAEVPSKKACGVVVVCAGDGISATYDSLGVDVVVSGGLSMNPSTEQLVEAIGAANAEHVIVLPNNKNVFLAAEQARIICGTDAVSVIPSSTLLHGIAAMLAYRPEVPWQDNVERMTEEMKPVLVGQVVRAVRNSTYQNREITSGQYLGFVNEDLTYVSFERAEICQQLLSHLSLPDAELVTVFYGENVSEDDINLFIECAQTAHHLDVEAHFGGQPIYDYLFTVE